MIPTPREAVPFIDFFRRLRFGRGTSVRSASSLPKQRSRSPATISRGPLRTREGHGATVDLQHHDILPAKAGLREALADKGESGPTASSAPCGSPSSAGGRRLRRVAPRNRATRTFGAGAGGRARGRAPSSASGEGRGLSSAFGLQVLQGLQDLLLDELLVRIPHRQFGSPRQHLLGALPTARAVKFG